MSAGLVMPSTVSSSVVSFSSCLPPFPASGSFLMSWPFASGGQSTGAMISIMWNLKKRKEKNWTHVKRVRSGYQGVGGWGKWRAVGQRVQTPRCRMGEFQVSDGAARGLWSTRIRYLSVAVRAGLKHSQHTSNKEVRSCEGKGVSTNFTVVTMSRSLCVSNHHTVLLRLEHSIYYMSSISL